MKTQTSAATNARAGRGRLFRRIRRSGREKHIIAVLNLTRALQREARNEGRRDAETTPLLTSPSPYQRRLRDECKYAIDVDMEEREHELAELLGDKEGNRKQHADRTERLEAAQDALQESQQELDKHDRPLWVGRMSWFPTSLLFFALGGFEYILIRTAIDGLNLDDYKKDLTAILIGVIPIIVIALTGSPMLEALGWHREKLEPRRKWAFSTVLLSTIGISVIGLIIAIGVVRGQAFAAGGILNAVPDRFAVSLAISLALLQAIATAAAVVVTRQQAEGDGWRKANADVTEQEGIIADLEDERLALEVEYAELLAHHRVFRAIAERHHLAIFDYFAAREACYLLILCRIHPEAKETFDTWGEWQEEVIRGLEPLYESFEPPAEITEEKAREEKEVEVVVQDIEQVEAAPDPRPSVGDTQAETDDASSST